MIQTYPLYTGPLHPCTFNLNGECEKEMQG